MDINVFGQRIILEFHIVVLSLMLFFAQFFTMKRKNGRFQISPVGFIAMGLFFIAGVVWLTCLTGFLSLGLIYELMGFFGVIAVDLLLYAVWAIIRKIWGVDLMQCWFDMK